MFLQRVHIDKNAVSGGSHNFYRGIFKKYLTEVMKLCPVCRFINLKSNEYISHGDVTI